jgi:DUF1009 family protein
MAAGESAKPIAILAGGGRMPALVAASANRGGHAPIVFAIAGEGDPQSFGSLPVHVFRWGQLGSLLRTAQESGCREAVFIGTVSQRPDIATVRPDVASLKFVPRMLKLITQGDHTLLEGMTRIFAEHGIALVGPLDVAPDLALPEGCLVGRVPSEAEPDIAKALEAARLIGSLDVAQSAVSVGGRIVALEDVGGTDALLERVAEYRRRGRIRKTGGVLVKCLKPQQDGRHDLPTIGPGTAERAVGAGLVGVAAEAGRTLLAGRDETIEAFRSAGLFLLGLQPPG